MSKKKNASAETQYDKIKRKLLNNIFFAVLALAVSAILTVSELIPALRTIVIEVSRKDQVTMLATVKEGKSCNYFDEEKEFIQHSVLDIGINNNSARDHMLTDVLLIPDGVGGCFFAGETDVSKTYSVLLDSWMEKSNCVTPLAPGDKLEPIHVKEIIDNKFVVKKQSQERFQISMGLSNAADYLRGKVIVEIRTDGEITLKSDPLEILICEP